MRTRVGVIAAVVVALTLTGCSGAVGGEPEAGETTPPASAAAPAQAEAASTPSPAPMPVGVSAEEEAFLGSARFADERSDADLLTSGYAACDALRSGEPVASDDEAVKFAAILALCPDVQ